MSDLSRASIGRDARLRRVTREALLVAAGQGAAALGGLVGIRWLTHALAPQAYGELALGMTAATLSLQTTLLPIGGAALRFFAPAREAGQLPAYLRAVRTLLGWSTLVVLIVLMAATLGLAAFGHGRWAPLLVGALVLSLTHGSGSTLDGMQTAARHRAAVAWHDGLDQWLRYSLAVALIGVVGAESAVAMGGYVCASILVLGSRLSAFRRRVLPLVTSASPVAREAAGRWQSQMLRYAWPFGAWGVFVWAQQSSDRWALQWSGGTAAVGMYAVLYQLGYYPVSVLTGLAAQFVAPILFSRAGDGSDLDRTRQTGHLNLWLVAGALALTAFAVLAAALLHRQVFALLVASEYHQVSALLPVMVLSGGLFAAGQMASLALMVVDSRTLLAPKMGTAVLGSLLNIGGAWRFGLPGVVAAGVIFSLVYLGWMMRLTRGRGLLRVPR